MWVFLLVYDIDLFQKFEMGWMLVCDILVDMILNGVVFVVDYFDVLWVVFFDDMFDLVFCVLMFGLLLVDELVQVLFDMGEILDLQVIYDQCCVLCD